MAAEDSDETTSPEASTAGVELQDGTASGELQDGTASGELQDGTASGELQDGTASGELQDGTAGGEIPDRRRPRRHRWLIEWAVVVVVALVVAVGVRTFVLQTFYIPSGSMEPTLDIGDRILVDKLSYDFHPVHRGDIIVFRRPPNQPEIGPPSIKDLVKRVIGLPGNTISSHGGQVYINGKLLPEPWLPPGTVTNNIRTQVIPPHEYFVMGDNRTDSLDSRYFGPIPGKLIVGRVVARIWPLSRFKIWF